MTQNEAAALPVYTGKDLGAVYARRHTVFTLWAPTASGAAVHRYATGTDAEPGAADLGQTPMQREEGGVWRATIAGDLAGQYYCYELSFPQGAQPALWTRMPGQPGRTASAAWCWIWTPPHRKAGLRTAARPQPTGRPGAASGRCMSAIFRPIRAAACGRNGAAGSLPSPRKIPPWILPANTRPV